MDPNGSAIQVTGVAPDTQRVSPSPMIAPGSYEAKESAASRSVSAATT